MIQSLGVPWWRLPDLMTPYLRLTVGVGALVTAVYLVAQEMAVAAWPLGLVGLYLVWDFVRHAGVWRAFAAFRRGELAAVHRELARTHRTSLLAATTRSYYHWLRGALEVADGRFAAARVHLLVAAAGHLKTDTDRALVQCLLAESALQEGDPATAAQHLDLARRLSPQPRVDRMVDALGRRVADTGEQDVG